MMPIVLNDLKNALLNNELCFYYQPQVNLQTHEVCGAEALIRWIKPNGEIIPPSEFIPLCEETGFITTITHQMIDVFLDDVSKLVPLNKNLKYSMNLSALDLKDKDILNQLKENNKKEYKSNVSYEITETSINDLTEDLFELENISFIMDDYGTGFSNLISLINTPFKKIKLDNTIIEGLFHNKKNEIIISETIALANKLNIAIVAEGVEDLKTYTFLLEHGCSEIQGYYIAKPLSYDEFITFISKKNIFFSDTELSPIKISLIDHISWIENITATVDKKIKEENINIDETLFYIRTEDQCDFGRWYHKKHHTFFSTNKHFLNLESIHHQQHLIAKKMLSFLLSNDDINLIKNLEVLHTTSIDLIQEIYKLNIDVFNYNYNLKNVKNSFRNH